ncbi:phosphatase domain-containing protein [Halobacteriovorax sp.]|uniref:phosphatase domain-containing protein n=1 Tax=Halobacteriovorax sp. TaxID=2020862 RepID=UPI0035665F0D
MKLLVILTILLSTSVQSKTLVISDVDDTLKRTNVLGYMLGGLRSTNPFIGLPALFNNFLCDAETTLEAKKFCIKFRGLNHSKERSLVYVTAATGRLQLFGREFISRSNFPQVPFIGKEIGQDTLEYKVDTLKEIISGGEYDEIILIGDNGEHDVAAYKAVTDAFPKRKISTFIHLVYNPYHKDDEKAGVALAKGQIPYFTASDLSVEFFARKLISESQLNSISREVFKYISSNDSYDYEQVMPDWSSCRPFISNYKRPEVKLSENTKYVLEAVERQLIRVCR